MTEAPRPEQAAITDPPTCPNCKARKATNFSHYERCESCGFKPPSAPAGAPEQSGELDWSAMYAKCEAELTATQEAAFAHAAARESAESESARLRAQLQTAEAQIAAVRAVVADIPESVFTAAEVGMLDEEYAIEAVGDLRIIRALLTPATSPGAGGGK